MLINAGIDKVYYEDGYPDELSLSLIGESNILLIKIDRGGEKKPSTRKRSPAPDSRRKRKASSGTK